MSPQTLLDQSWFFSVYLLQTEKSSCTRGLVNWFLRVPQAYSSCNIANKSKQLLASLTRFLDFCPRPRRLFFKHGGGFYLGLQQIRRPYRVPRSPSLTSSFCSFLGTFLPSASRERLIQGTAKRWSQGSVNAEGKARQK